MICFKRYRVKALMTVWISLLWIFTVPKGFTQQLPQYTQYIFNNYIVNPAITGIENYTDFKTSYRTQWQGIDGAPETGTFSIHAPIGRNFSWDNATSFAGNGNNPMSRSYLQNYRASEPHHGIGLVVVLDKIGPISNTYGDLTYAYHLGLAPQLNLSVGVAAGVSYVTLDRSKLAPGNPADETIASDLGSQLSPNLGAGLWLYSPRFFVGISGMQLLSGNLLGTGNGQTINIVRKVPHFYFTTGYKVFLAEDIAFLPSILLQKAGHTDLSIDLNSKVAFRDRLWLGASYRKGDSFSVLTGLNISHLINIGYSYDFTTSALKKVSGGTHEVILGILLNNKYKVSSSQRNW